MENRPIPKAGEFYMHFKGKLYQIVTVATHTETEEELVVYQALYGTYGTFARPLAMFMSEVDHEKYPEAEQKYRFSKVEFCDNTQDNVGIKIPDGESAQKQYKVSENVQEISQEVDERQEDDIEPLLKFLDATDLNDRLNILVQYRDQITETMLESMGMAIECVLNGKTLEEKYYELDKVIRTKLQYEKKPRV